MRPGWRAAATLWVCSLLLGLSPMWARAQTDAATAELLMRRSGLWAQLGDVAPQVRAGLLHGLAEGGLVSTASETRRLLSLFDGAYAAEPLRGVAAETMRLSLRPDQVPTLQAWFEAPLGQRITGLEAAASAEQDQPEGLMRRGQALLQDMPAPRRALLARLVALSHATDAAVQISTDTALAVQRGLRSAGPGLPSLPEAELRSALQAREPQLRVALGGLVLASFALTYQGLSEAELAEYLEFLASAPGAHFMAVSLSAFGAALVAASTELGRGLPGIKDQANI